ncbi:glycoside hydrolase family 44 protein [Archangium violaceum]|uniref:glycoside hydrolase family 44 protein n=1 Tax=Archangium violaceum TaxID=83451 RepID=UPI00193BA59E|nr:glycoside hydrolase family 44 protein [Archangium violaceum]QRK10869.1 glycoside hydrolase family 44 protein [Archangium violaceum]
MRQAVGSGAPWRGRRTRTVLLVGVCLGVPLVGVSLLGSCRQSTSRAATTTQPSSPSGVYNIPPLTETAYAGTLQPGWNDEGWSERELKDPGPAKLRMANMGGWMLHKTGIQGEFGGLALRYRAPSGFGDFLEVRLDSEGETLFPRVRVDASHVARREGDWVQLFVPLEQLNPEKVPFTRIVIRAYKKVSNDWVELDQVGLTAPGGMTPAEGTSLVQQSPQPGTAARVIVEPMELAYDNGLQEGWEDHGWSERELKGPTPAKLRMGNMGGWMLRKTGLQGEYGGLTLRYRAPSDFGDFLEVRLDSESETLFPRVRLSDTYVTARDGDWTQVFVPMDELNPEKKAFTQLVLRAYKKVGNEQVELNQVGLARLVTPAAVMQQQAPPDAASVGGGRVAFGDAKATKVVVDCAASSHPISPLIYGIAFNNLRELKDSHQWELGATARRWGGNPTTRYNWKLGNVWNTANDYFFRNIVLGTSPQYTYDTFLQSNLQRGMQSALTVPIIGWVAKDSTSVSFPKSLFGVQQKMDPDVTEAGNGISPSGDALTPPLPTQTSVEAPPAFIHEWVRTIREKDKTRGRSVHMYILDNEPMLWNTTHRDVHPEPATYDELLERTIAYGTAVRQADPDAVIAGPAEWGWTNYYNSAADLAPGGNKKDRKAHGNMPLLAWYLKKLHEHEKQTGTRLLDVVDVHFYPQGEGIGFEERGATDPDTSARRIRSTRALWDPKYKDESWIDDKIELIPRIKRWIAENYPGRGLSIGEYNFGATGHMSGGLAQAEALGRFAEQNLTSAFLFTYPPYRSPAFWAFRAYRNFDGKGGRFQDNFVPSKFDKESDTQGMSLFASRSDDGKRLVAIALNLEPDSARNAQVELRGCGNVANARVLGYAGEPSGFSERKSFLQSGSNVQVMLPPWSITVLDLTLTRR